MSWFIEKTVRCPRLTVGRRHLALTRMRAIAADDPDLKVILPAMDDAIAAQERMSEKELRWRRAQDDLAMHAREAQVVDRKLDRSLSAIHVNLTHAMRAYEPDEALHGAAARLLDALMPTGVGPIVTLPYVDQHAAVSQLLRTLDASPELLVDVGALGLDALVAKTRALNSTYGGLLTQRERMTWDKLKAEERASWLELTSVVARIVGILPTNAPDHVTRRTAVLLPIQDQVDELAERRARRATGRPGAPAGTDEDEDLFEDLDDLLDEDAA